MLLGFADPGPRHAGARGEAAVLPQEDPVRPLVGWTPLPSPPASPQPTHLHGSCAPAVPGAQDADTAT